MSASIIEKISKAQEDYKAEEKARIIEEKSWREKWGARKAKAQESFLNNCRPAKVSDYAEWLMEYLDLGNSEITHVYKYNMPAGFLVVEKPGAVITPLLGAEAVSIIIPKGIEVEIQALGHICVYSHDAIATHKGIVPLYDDVSDFIHKNK